MTEDYKSKLLKYLTGKLSNETGSNTPQFGDYSTNNNNTRQQIADELETSISNIIIRGYVTSEQYEEFLLYGINNDTSKSFVGIFSSKMELIQLIQTFDSGSDLFTIISLQIAEDGKFYGLSQDVADGVYTVRILLLNNIFASGLKNGTYSIKLRNDYIIPSSNNFRCIATANKDVIKKAQDEAIYYVTGFEENNTQTKVVKFQINIEGGNTWDTYSMGNNVYYAQSRFTVLLNKEGDTYSYYAYALDVINDKYVVYKIDGEGNITNPKSINLTGDVDFQSSQVLAINNNLVYVSIGNATNLETSIYKVSNNNLVLVETTPWAEMPDESYSSADYYLQNINNNVFVTKYYPSTNGKYIYLGMIIDTTLYYKQEGQGTAILTKNFNLFTVFTETYIKNQYNLYSIYINSDFNNQTAGTYLNNLSLVYNSNNYNGLPYEALNCLVPNSGILYDDNDDVIFARNLYNKTVSGQTTTSTVQIPNTLLNNDTIAQNDLIGQTNGVLVSDNTQFTKNIYETVDLNFSNTLIIRNDNDENNKILNPIGASRLNNSVSQTVDYGNAQATKIKVNYSDNTNIIIELNPAVQVTLINDTQATYSFNIYVQKEIDNIQIISQDENTVYQTISGLNLTIGKTYNITQDVEVL
jgi:hypothetical protein